MSCPIPITSHKTEINGLKGRRQPLDILKKHKLRNNLILKYIIYILIEFIT